MDGLMLEGWILGFAVFSFTMAATPGPNNTMLAASGAAFGFMKTVPHMLGFRRLPIMLVLVGLGVGEALETVPFLIPAMQAVGADAVVACLAGRHRSCVVPTTDRRRRRSRPMTVLEAAAFQWVNPKAWMIAAGAMATFAYTAEGEASADPARLLSMGIIFFVMTIPSVAIWAGFGSAVRRFLPTPVLRRRFNQAMAILLVASIGLAFL